MTRKLYAERPGWGKDFDYDEARHLAAYRYAAKRAKSKVVLDAGCGEGFGTQTLADVAASVVGIDYHAESIETARAHWKKPNLSFRVLDLSTEKLDENAYDVIVNFQVLEHIEDDRAFLARLKAGLKRNGTLILTTPNAPMSFSENPFHLREYTAVELRKLLSQVFDHVEVFGVFGNEKVQAFDRQRRRAVERILKLDAFGIRKLLPDKMMHAAFARLGQLVRKQAHRKAGPAPIVPEDFEVRGGKLDEALDLLALCRA